MVCIWGRNDLGMLSFDVSDIGGIKACFDHSCSISPLKSIFIFEEVDHLSC